MARRILISRYNFVPLGTLSGGSWSADDPLNNLQDINPQKPAIAASADPADTQFTFDIGFGQAFGLFHFANLNVDSGAKIRLRAGSDPTFAVNTYDSGTVDAWPKHGVDQYPSDEFIALGRPRCFIPPAVIAARYIKVEITNATTVPQIGVFAACQVLEPSRNISYDWSIVPADESDVRRVPFGSTYVTAHSTRRRKLAFGIKALPQDETIHLFLSAATALGKSTPLVVSPTPDDTDNLERLTVYGTFSQDPQFSNPFFGQFQHVYAVDQLT